MRSRSFKDYEVALYYDPRAGYYVAEIPNIPTCAADGPTPAEAIAALETTFAVMKEAYAEEKLTLPQPKAALPVESLNRAADVLNMSRVAQRAGMSPQTLASKMQRGTPLKPGEARRITRALGAAGVHVAAKAS
jgi:predicted RNase H-like HicB family nuclease